MKKEIKAFMLRHQRSGDLVFQAGVSFRKLDIHPIRIYEKEYKSVPVIIKYNNGKKK